MHWSELEERQPRLAALGRDRLIERGVILVATTRRDGTPRLSPVEPFLMDKDLWLSMLWESRKALDLLRDPRILVHSIVTSRDGTDGEFKIRGIAQGEDDRIVHERYAKAVTSALGWRPEPSRFHLFWVDIQNVTFIRYDDSAGDQYCTMWPPGSEFVRRGTSATSVGGPEPICDLFIPEHAATRADISDGEATDTANPCAEITSCATATLPANAMPHGLNLFNSQA